MHGGIEWVVDAFDCDTQRLSQRDVIVALLDHVVARAGLHVLQSAVHAFGPISPSEQGGVTAMYLLAESHLTIHTFPEAGTATLNLYCCRPRQALDWPAIAGSHLGAARVVVRELDRG